MPLEFYKFVHILGVIMVVMALGGAMMFAIHGGTKATNRFRKGLAITHGIGQAFALVGGFGMLARLGIMASLPIWVMIKLVIWLVLGGVLAVIFRKPELARTLWFLILAITSLAAFLGIFKPF